MPIYKNGQPFNAFKGEYRPLNLYKGNLKIVGWKYAELSGESLLVNDIYNDDCAITIKGKSTQVSDSPTIENPSEISSTSSFELITVGDNLFDYKAFLTNLQSNGYVDCELLENKEGIRFNSIIHNYEKSTYLKRYFEPNTRYTLSATGQVFNPTNTAALILFFFKYTDGTKSPYLSFSPTLIAKSITSASNKTVDCIGISRQYDGDAEVYDFQLNKGTTASPYTPSKGMNITNIPYTLRRLSEDIYDEIIIDNIAKTAKLIKRIHEFTLTVGMYVNVPYSMYIDTNSNGHLIQLHGELFYGIPIMANLGNRYGEILSNVAKFSTDEGEENTVRAGFTGPYATRILWRVPLSAFTIPEGSTDEDKKNIVKNWLTSEINNGKQFTFQYQMSTEVIEDLDYEAVKTYYPQTNIYTNAVVQPTLEGKFRVMGGTSK